MKVLIVARHLITGEGKEWTAEFVNEEHASEMLQRIANASPGWVIESEEVDE